MGNHNSSKNIIFKRPIEVYKNPKFIVDGIDIRDIYQGEFGTCWMLCILQHVALNYNLFKQITNPYQTFESDNHNFIFFFPGIKKLITIDDYLPYDINKKTFICSRNKKCKNEFLVSLMEKAIIKCLNISYSQANEGGFFDKSCKLLGFKPYSISNSPNIKTNDLLFLLKQKKREEIIVGCWNSNFSNLILLLTMRI